MNRWRLPTLVATAPPLDDPEAWTRLRAALIDALDVGYRAIRLHAQHYDPRLDALLEPVIRRGLHTQLALGAGAIIQALDAGPGTVLDATMWLVELPGDGQTDLVLTEASAALERLAQRGLRRGLSVSLTKTRARDLEATATLAAQQLCSLLVICSGVSGSHDLPDELERSMAYVTARRAGREYSALRIEIDLHEREGLARWFATSLSSSVPLTCMLPTLVISGTGQVDPLRAGITGFSLGTLEQAALVQLLARWRTACAARWVALGRATITRVGRVDAWPVVDWPAELAACATSMLRAHPTHAAESPRRAP